MEYKKRLLGYLFAQPSVPFLLISSFDISHFSVVRRLMKSRDNINLQTITCEQIKALVETERSVRKDHRQAGIIRKPSSQQTWSRKSHLNTCVITTGKETKSFHR